MSDKNNTENSPSADTGANINTKPSGPLPSDAPKRSAPRDKAKWLVSLGSWIEATGRRYAQGEEPDFEAIAKRAQEQLGKCAPEGSSWQVTYTAPQSVGEKE